MKQKGKKEMEIDKEAQAESYCLVCKDGGDLRICDNKECLKCFHPSCVGKDDSFLQSDDYWECNLHSCLLCHRYSFLYCYTCTSAVCRRCLPTANFFKIKGKYGFCGFCLKVALLIEENKDYDSDGVKVDFTDVETVECLFVDYYYNKKEEQGFELRDLHDAEKWQKKREEVQSGSGLEEYEEEEDQISDYDGTEDKKKCKGKRKGNRSKREKSAQTPTKSNKCEFIGWASRALTEFLISVGKNPKEKLMLHDVTSIINEYVKENKLLNPEKRKMIMCDALLQSLFRKRTISRNRISELLEPHFAEYQDESEEDELGCSSEEENSGTPNVRRKQRKLDMGDESLKMDLEDNVHPSSLASIIVKNIKLVYLKRSLLRELLKQPQTFGEKVIGCFVRVKSDPHDYSSRNSHQLKQVEGVKRVSTCENQTEIFLLFSTMPTEISLNLLSDGDFSEEECEELRQKMVTGQLKRPTVGFLQQKAKILHEDITKHWINEELVLLQNLIDQANEKGWRRELFEYIEKKKRLQTPLEQSKLLENAPKVIPDICENNSTSEDITSDMNSDKRSPQSINRCNLFVPNAGSKVDKESEERTQHDNVWTGPPQHDRSPGAEFKHNNITSEMAFQLSTDQLKTASSEQSNLLENVQTVIADVCKVKSNSEDIINGTNSDNVSPRSIVQCNSYVSKASEGETCGYNKITGAKQFKLTTDQLKNIKVEGEELEEICSREVKREDKAITRAQQFQLTTDQLKMIKVEVEESEEICSQVVKKEHKALKIDVIELLSSDDEENENREASEEPHNKCSLDVSRKWSESTSHASEFKSWKEDENEENAIWLVEAVSIAFPKKSMEIRSEEKTYQDHKASRIDVIELMSDDEENEIRELSDDLESERWCVRGPDGEFDKCSLAVMRKWSKSTSYASRFKVWKEDEKEENAIWLLEATSIAVPKKSI